MPTKPGQIKWNWGEMMDQQEREVQLRPRWDDIENMESDLPLGSESDLPSGSESDLPGGWNLTYLFPGVRNLTYPLLIWDRNLTYPFLGWGRNPTYPPGLGSESDLPSWAGVGIWPTLSWTGVGIWPTSRQLTDRGPGIWSVTCWPE